MSWITSLLEAPDFLSNSEVHNRLHNVGLLFNVFNNFVMNFGEEIWKGAEDCWLKHLDIIHQVECVVRRVADSEAKHESVDVQDLLVDVRQGHVREIHVVGSIVEAQILLTCLPTNKVHMRQHSALRFASRARGDSQNQNGVFGGLLLLDIHGPEAFSDHIVELIELQPQLCGKGYLNVICCIVDYNVLYLRKFLLRFQI